MKAMRQAYGLWVLVAILLAGPGVAEDTSRQRDASEGEFLFELLGALSSDTVGMASEPSPQIVSSYSYAVMALDGGLRLNGPVFYDVNRFLHGDGGPTGGNTALGLNALISLTPGVPNLGDGKGNTAVGDRALLNTSSGDGNLALGASALVENTLGRRNVAVGSSALVRNIEGGSNVAIGNRALFYTTASNNIALGLDAGYENTTGSNNIFIGNRGVSPGTEVNTLRIGSRAAGAAFPLAKAFIAGIANVNIGDFTHTVCVNTQTDQLGTCPPSSLRFKEDIESVTGAGKGLLGLRVVKFRYKEEIAKSAERQEHYGLIAEEVAEVYPHLVTYDGEGRPTTVRYEALTPLLLGQLQRQHGLNAVMQAEIEELRQRLARLEEGG